MSGHKWPGAPWPSGIYMTQNRYMLTNDVPSYDAKWIERAVLDEALLRLVTYFVAETSRCSASPGGACYTVLGETAQSSSMRDALAGPASLSLI